MKHRLPVIIVCLALVLIVLPVLTACGETSTSSPSASATSAPPTSSTPAPTSSQPITSTSTPPTSATSNPPTSSTAPISTPSSTPTTSTAPSPTSSYKANLTFATAGSLTAATYTKFVKPWEDEITRQTGGRITFTTYASETLVKQQDEYDAVVKDIADVSYAPHPASPGRFPGFDVFALPLLAVSTVDDSGALIRKVYADFKELQAEHSDVHLLDLLGVAPYEISTTKKPVNALQDLKGLRIGGPAAATTLPPDLGAIPVQITAGELYSALDKGVIDGTILPVGVLVSFGLNPLLKYTTICNLGAASQWMAMNPDQWNKMPPDIQAVFNNVLGHQFWPAAAASQTQTSFDQMQKLGDTVIYLSSDEMSKWYSAVQSTWTNWVTDAKAKGITQSQAILDEVYQLVQQYNAQEAAAAKK